VTPGSRECMDLPPLRAATQAASRPPPADNWCKNDREEFAKLNTLLAQVRRARREDAG
jgi:hypothetical protein